MDHERLITPDHLRSARALLGWSQADLAAAAGLGLSIVADFEGDRDLPEDNTLLALQQALEVAGVGFSPLGATLFSEIALHLTSEGDGCSLVFRFKAEAAMTVARIISVFGTLNGGAVDIEGIQQATPALKAAVDALVAEHGKAVPPLNRLRAFLNRIPDDQFFLILPEPAASTMEKLDRERLLRRLNAPDQVDAWEEGVEALFGRSLELYDWKLPRTDRQTVIGDKESRRCRFCRRDSAAGASFSKVAHIVPRALGNEHLKSNEECDDCNGYFGEITEPSLIGMLDIQRAFLGTQGRGGSQGRPTLIFEQGDLRHDGQKLVVRARAVKDDADGVLEVELGKGATPITPSAAYRALVKMALSIIDPDELQHLQGAIDWVRHGTGERPLPRVATITVDLSPDPSAQIGVWVRKAPHPTLPHVVGEFRLGCFLQVFAVPFSTLDDTDLVGFFEDNAFKATFKQYAALDQWHQYDLSGRTARRLAPTLRFAPKET